MSGQACQRWRDRRPAWVRPEAGVIDPARYGVAPIEADGPAKAFVTGHHYSGTYPAAARRFGLFDLAAGGALAGVAVLSVPARREVLTGVFPGLEPYAESLELGRFVLLDEVPANGESWFLAEVHRLAAATGVRGLVMFSDPMPRRTAAGDVVMPGHVGTIYQATNATYTGRGTARTLTVLRDGTVLSDRAQQKIRAQDRGHEYAERALVELGARARRAGESPAAWLAAALADTAACKVRHPGNHRYAFTLGTRRERARVAVGPAARRYPKQRDGEQAGLFGEAC